MSLTIAHRPTSTNKLNNLDNADYYLAGAISKIKEKNGAEAGQMVTEAMKQLRSGTISSEKEINALKDLQDLIERTSLNPNSSDASVDELLLSLDKNRTDISDKKARLENAEKQNATLAESLTNYANSALYKSKGNGTSLKDLIKSGKIIAAADSDFVPDIPFGQSSSGSSSSSSSKYKYGDLLALQGKDEIISGFAATGYNWLDYAGDDFYNFFLESQKVRKGLSTNKGREFIGSGDQNEYVEVLNHAGEATSGDGWRSTHPNTALTVANVVERSSGQWVSYGFNNDLPFGPTTQWDCSRSSLFLIDFSINAEHPEWLDGLSTYEATIAQDAFSLKLNPTQIRSNYPQITDPSKIQPGDTLYVKFPKNSHTMNVIANIEEAETLITYDTNWGLNQVGYDQIVTKPQNYCSDEYLTCTSGNIKSAKFIATDMTQYAEEQKTLIEYSYNFSKENNIELTEAYSILHSAIKYELQEVDNKKGSTIKHCKRIIHKIEDSYENVTLEIKKGRDQNGNEKTYGRFDPKTVR